MPRGTPSLEELVAMAMEAKLATVNVALPGRVESYNASTQRADIRPVIRRAVPTPEEDYILEDLPVIPNVRVIHPGGEDWAIHVPIKEGDTVELIFQQWDPSEWMRTGEVSEPADKRRFSLSHAVALPGFRKADQTIPGAVADAITITHKDGFSVKVTDQRVEVGGSSDSAALASKVADLETAVANMFSTFNGGTGGAAFPNPFAPPGNYGSAKLKVGG